jgi:PIN domain
LKNNYILIDYENVQPRTLNLVKAHAVKVLIFIGANQAKVPLELASSLQALGSNAEYVRIAGNGSNALDFHISFYIGELAACDPDAYFHIISQDTGFDPLIKHAKSRGIAAQRHKDLVAIPFLRFAGLRSLQDKIAAIVEDLSRRGDTRPRKVKALANTINALFMKTLEESELTRLIEELCERRYVVLDNERVSYGPQISQPT